METTHKIQLKELCDLLCVDQRELRYVLEEGHVPRGVAKHPSTGNRREFGPDQAFWLAIVVKLRHAGVKTPLAAHVADFASKALRAVTQNFNWEWTFLPMAGWFETEHQYFLDVGDLTSIRLVTDANPGISGLYEFPWTPVKGRGKPDPTLRPFVTLRLDVTKIASVLGQVDQWTCPHRNERTRTHG